MQLLYQGKLTKKQVQAWIVNRFFLQSNITIKDAAIISNCPVPEVRRIWLARTLRREGLGDIVGDVDGWLGFAEAAGIRKEKLLKTSCLPGVRFAVDGLVNFAKRANWLDGISTSLYEIPAKDELLKRTVALKTNYTWIDPVGMKFFSSRISRIERDADAVIDLVLTYTKDSRSLRSAVQSALFMSNVVWTIHDAIFMNYVVQDMPLSHNSV
jgi:pyrroloquinoline-quinone synthase